MASTTERFFESLGVKQERIPAVAQCLDRLFLCTGAFGAAGFLLGWRRVRRM